MKSISIHIGLIISFFTIIISCSNDEIILEELPVLLDKDVQIIPIEDALSTLSDFVQEVYPEMMTKANTLDNLIKSVDIHYNQTTLTKSDVSIADAYIVNFVDDGGFAVLGANTRVDEIVAVSEYGSISLEEIDSAYTNLSRSVKAFYCDDGNIITNYYCKEDDDYYSAGQFLFPILVYNGLDSDGRIGVAPCGNDSGSGFCTVLPMLSTKWSQGKYHTSGVYNKYCKKGSNYVYAGCSTTALAQIIAYNHFPKIICGIEMDYQNMTVRPVASDLRTEYGEQVSLLFGDIFNNVVTLSGGEGTLITPEQIKKKDAGVWVCPC